MLGVLCVGEGLTIKEGDEYILKCFIFPCIGYSFIVYNLEVKNRSLFLLLMSSIFISEIKCYFIVSSFCGNSETFVP